MEDKKISLVNGDINESDIPLVVREPWVDTYLRATTVLGVFLVGLIIYTYHVINHIKLNKKISGITTQLLSEEADRRLSRCDRLDAFRHNLYKIPYVNIVEIGIPVDSFPNGFRCLNSLKFYIITNDQRIFEIMSGWHIFGDMYVARFKLPNLTKLYGLQIYVSPDLIPSSFRVIDIKLRDKNGNTIWKDMVIIDLQSRDTSNGIIQDKYIVIQFDLDKYT